MTAPSPQEAGASDLLPCPFCGGHAVERAGMGESWICCALCGASTDLIGMDAAAIAAWNRRAAPMEAVAWREKVAAIIDETATVNGTDPHKIPAHLNVYEITEAILQALAVIPTQGAAAPTPDDVRGAIERAFEHGCTVTVNAGPPSGLDDSAAGDQDWHC